MYLSIFYNEPFIKILLFDGQTKINKIVVHFDHERVIRDLSLII